MGSVMAPTHLEAGRNTHLLFVVSEVSKFMTMVNYKSIFVIRLQDNKIISTLPSPRNPVKLVVSADCRTVYVVDHEKSSATYALYQIDVENKKISGSLPLDGPVSGMCISQDGAIVYISMAGLGKILVVGAIGLKLAQEILVQDSNGRHLELRDIIMSPDGTKLYAATGSKVIAVIGLKTGMSLTFIHTSFNASTMATDAAENLLYVACALLDLLIIDMITDQIVKRMTMEQGLIKKVLVGPS
jgi:DNA-binding beta-propeller fold protein YncE